MPREYLIVDVFTDRPFGGNQLTVFPDAAGLCDATMQAIAREFLHESAFVLPPSDSRNTARVRIFTQRGEVPFAGHPSIGTAYVLALLGRLGERDGARDGETHARLEEDAGPVEVTVQSRDGRPVHAELIAPQELTLGDELDPADVGLAISVHIDDVVGARHRPRIASVGLPFLFVELCDLEALARARPLEEDFEARLSAELATGVMAYVRTPGGSADLRARMFAPLVGVPEDPATGSAAAALAGLLATLESSPGEGDAWTLDQGIEMGRPSRIETRVERAGDAIVAIRVGGDAALVARGTLEIDPD